MANDREDHLQQQQGTGSEENIDENRQEQFNELSELSLEERMAVADQIGVPVNNVSDAVALGTASVGDDAAEGSNDRMEQESTGEEMDR